MKCADCGNEIIGYAYPGQNGMKCKLCFTKELKKLAAKGPEV